MSVSTDLAPRGESQVSPGTERTKNEPMYSPLVDIYETQEALVLLADLPGVGKDDLHIKLDEEILTIEGVAKASSAPGQRLLSEWDSGAFYRQFALGEAIDRAKIQAKLKDGVLELVLPKAEKAKPKRIEVQAG